MKKFILAMLIAACIGTQTKAVTRAAFIYNTDLTDANAFKTFLESNGFTVSLIAVANTITTNYSNYDVIITSPASSLTKEQMDTISSKNKPIVSMGSGGYNSLGQLSLEIGKPYGMSGTENTMFVENASLTVYNTPKKVSVSSGDSIRLFSVAATSSPARMIYVPVSKPYIEGLVRYRPLYYSVVRQNGKFTFWGFALSPASMTQAAKDLFINVASAPLATSIAEWSAQKEGKLVVNRQSATLTVGGYSGDETVSVYDLSGKMVIRSLQQPNISLSELKKGVYVVRIASTKGLISKKFVY